MCFNICCCSSKNRRIRRSQVETYKRLIHVAQTKLTDPAKRTTCLFFNGGVVPITKRSSPYHTHEAQSTVLMLEDRQTLEGVSCAGYTPLCLRHTQLTEDSRICRSVHLDQLTWPSFIIWRSEKSRYIRRVCLTSLHFLNKLQVLKLFACRAAEGSCGWFSNDDATTTLAAN